jgi:hypothetical protein
MALGMFWQTGWTLVLGRRLHFRALVAPKLILRLQPRRHW